MNTSLQLMRGTLLLLTCALIVFVYMVGRMDWRLQAGGYGRYISSQLMSFIEPVLVTNASTGIRTSVSTIGVQVGPKYNTAIPVPGVHKTRPKLKGDLIAAIFSCNTHFLSTKRGPRFPRTFECPRTDNKRITFISTINNMIGIADADVVVFAAGVSSDIWEQAMRLRTSRQVWVYSTAESQVNSPQVWKGRRPTGFAGYHFNMSFLYHSKSEVLAPFGEYIPFNGRRAERKIYIEIAPKRAKNMIAWVSSHCMTRWWNRAGFVHDLAKFLPVHVYGECGTMPRLPRGKHARLILKKYKFYIAFENSCCSEYISEKFWQPMVEFDSVPIVVGASRADYERVAPPNSFIFADDFDSIRDLARYIRTVANNDTLYQEYHRWRTRGQSLLYGSNRVYPFASTEGACSLLNFVEQNAWKVNRSLRMRIDPYGPDWLGRCGICGKKDFMERYHTANDPYDPGKTNLTDQ